MGGSGKLKLRPSAMIGGKTEVSKQATTKKISKRKKVGATLSEGQKAPKFNLLDKNGDSHSLEQGTHDFTVLFFYPKDDTPGCTIEAKGFSQDLPKFSKLKTRLLGISGGDAKSKEKFCRKHDLKTTLLSDPDFEVAKRYESYGQKSFMGRKYFGIMRKTFVINSKGILIKIFDTVKPEGHPREVFEFIRRQSSSPNDA
ncbi:MAG: peroxiredoxin [Bdellovibrionales bacterium]|nr:peroxiredoxin [Bdellovibrionales bacterium]